MLSRQIIVDNIVHGLFLDSDQHTIIELKGGDVLNGQVTEVRKYDFTFLTHRDNGRHVIEIDQVTNTNHTIAQS